VLSQAAALIPHVEEVDERPAYERCRQHHDGDENRVGEEFHVVPL